LDATTGLADSFNANLGGSAYAVAVQPDGKILVGGGFSIGGQRNDLARLDPTTGLADSFDPNANSEVYSIALQTDGKVLVGGGFTTLSPNGGGAVTRNNIARLETDGRLDRTLNLGIVGDYVLATAVQPDGKILIGGNFTSVLGLFRNNIARLNTDGTLDTNFNPNANNIVESIAVQADGKIIAAGDFTDIGGANRNYIARLDATTGLADSFNPNANSVVAAIAVQADGKILVGGNFTVIGGTNRNLMARLNPTNGLADSFNPNASGNPSFFPGVNSIAVQADGKILAGGNFTVIGGTNRNLIARLDPTNGLADSFNPNASGIPSFSLGVNAIAVQTDGKILAGGDFTVIGGTNRNCIARLDATTGLADSFNPNANSRVFTIAVQTDGKILLGGAFNGTNSIGGTNRNYIARLDPNGVVDAFNPNANNWVAAIAVQTDGKIMAGGYFASIGGQTRSRFARLGNDTAALQNLALSQNTITWTRDGSSPQLTRAIFEYSTNSVNYTPLGNATAAGSNWTLTGLNLPTGTNIYIRARGFYRGGYLNGSQSIHESVRNVFLTPQPRLNIQRSATTNVVVSWATNFPGFTLEAKTNLNTNVWSVVTNAPAVRGTNNVVTNATSGAARFYRLRQ
jgi:uncharacterized delta-60 repeat protein